MESNEGCDDQGSGWMQVKKKHRSNSKFPPHGGSVKLPGKHSSTNPSHMPSLIQKSANNINESLSSVTGRECAVLNDSNASTFTPISAEKEAVDDCIQKSVVLENEFSDSCHSTAIGSEFSRCKLPVVQEHSSRGNILPNIKWGDLDEGTLVHYGKNSEEIYKELNEVSSEDVKEQIASEKIVMGPIFNLDHGCLKSENDEFDDTYGKNTMHEASEDEATRKIAEAKSDTGLNVSEVPVTDSASSMGPAIPEDREIGSNLNEFSDTVNTDVTNTEHTDESKERFRERLWCFLFETLNRSVDELYLLCELECDLDQMREASLVLEEAASDFRELKSRVEKFEKLRRSHEIDGAPLIIQSDHRRPHALSWEVRRMTTSPRRAEILSSSLEAFRKIQHERSTERTKNSVVSDHYNHLIKSGNNVNRAARKGVRVGDSSELTVKPRKQTGISDSSDSCAREKRNVVNGRSNRELHGSSSEADINKRVKMLTGNNREKNSKSADLVRRHARISEKEREKRNGEWAMDAWKEKRNWEDILALPHRVSSRFSYSPGLGRKSHVLHDKLMSPEKKKKSSIDLKKDAEEKHARATRIRAQLENEKVQKLQRTSEKLNRVNQWQTVRSNKLRESIFDRHQRSESRHEAYLARVVRRAGDESSKVNEVRFITSLNEENKKHILRKKLEDSEVRRAEKLQVMKSKQKEDMAREEAVLERRRLIEAEKLQRLAETQRKKEEAQIRWEEERKASNAAREAKAMEKMRKKEIRAKARKEEAELLAQKLAEKLSESDQRRKFYLEQIRERASMDFRDQSSPFLRRILGKEAQAQGNSGDLANSGSGDLTTESRQNLLKRRIKKIRQRLMSLKHEFTEPSAGAECSSIGYRTAVGTARGKIGRWIQDLQKFRQARKEGAANFGLISAEMTKFLDGKEAELQACRQAGLLDFIASALPASHTSKPEACQVTIFLLRLIRIALATAANKCYFLVQNLLPPIIPMLAAALENHIKIAASSTVQGQNNKTSIGNLESISEIVDSFLWIVAAIIGYGSCNENQLQMQYGLVELVIAYQIIHRLRDLVALYDRPQVEGSPFPSSILLSINLLVVITSKFRESSIDWESFPNKLEQMRFLEHQDVSLTTCIADSGPEHSPSVPECRTLDETSTTEQIKTVDFMDEASRVPTDDKHFGVQKSATNTASISAEQSKESGLESKHPAKFLLSAMAETGLVCLPSMLTAVLLQGNNRLSVDQGSYTLPSNFEEVATGVLKVLNNLALIDVTFIQKMLARPDLKMEFFHLMSFLLSHCTSNWGVPTDKIGFLLMESLSLLGYFALFHPGNQAVLRWGKSPTILHKVCDLPFVFFSDPELMPVLASTLIAASYGCEQNKAVIQQELSMDMLIPSLKSCKTISIQNSMPVQDSGDSNQMSSESKKPHADALQRPNRNSVKSTRLIPQKSGALANNARIMRIRNQRDVKLLKVCEDIYFGSNQSETDTSSLMLHCRFPVSFIDKAEQFFIVEVNTGNGESV